MNWNPFKKKAEPFVYVGIELDKPLQGITEKEPPGLWVKLTGIGLVKAAQVIPGKSIDWHSIPMSIRASWEMEPFKHEMTYNEFKRWFR